MLKDLNTGSAQLVPIKTGIKLLSIHALLLVLTVEFILLLLNGLLSLDLLHSLTEAVFLCGTLTTMARLLFLILLLSVDGPNHTPSNIMEIKLFAE